MRTNIYRFLQRRPIQAGVALVLLAYLIAFGFIEQRGLYGDDPANKLLLIETLKKTQYNDVAIEPPGRQLDPGFRYNPLSKPFYVLQNDNKLYSVYPPFFSLLSSPFHFAFGLRGLYVLPLLSTLILLVGVGSILNNPSLTTKAVDESGKKGKSKPADKRGDSAQYWSLPFIGIIIAGLFTPLLFYSQVFWEHATAGALLVWSVKFLADYLHKKRLSRLIAAAVLASLSVYFRDSLYVFVATALVTVVLFSAGQRIRVSIVFIVTATLTIFPLWLFQWQVTGSPFGYHISSHLNSAAGFVGHIFARPEVFYNLLIASFEGVLPSVLLILPFVLLLVSSPIVAVPAKKFTSTFSFIAVAALLIALAIFVNLLNAKAPALHMLNTSNSFLTISPILLLAIIRPGETGLKSLLTMENFNFVRILLVLYILAYIIAAPLLGTKGIHWGNRFLYVAYPLLAVLVAGNIGLLLGISNLHKTKVRRLRQPGVAVIVLLAILSFAMQVWSLDFLDRKKRFSFDLNDVLQKRQEQVIVSDVWWALQEIPELYYERLLFHVKGNRDYSTLIGKLKNRGYKNILLITRQEVGQTQPDAINIYDNGLGLFSLSIIPVKL